MTQEKFDKYFFIFMNTFKNISNDQRALVTYRYTYLLLPTMNTILNIYI